MTRHSAASSSTRALLIVAGLAVGLAMAQAATAGSPPLATVTVGQGGPAERLLDGTVESVHQATLSAQTASRVAEIPADVNDSVAAGTVLLRLRGAEQAAGLGQAQAALQAATAREREAQARYSRINDMYARKVVAKATFDEAQAARDSAVAQLEAARAGVAAARENVGYTELRAPYAGVVTQKYVQVGEAVGPGAPLMAIAALDALRVVTDLPQGVAEQVRAEKKATVLVGAQRIAAAAVTVFPAADPRTNTFRARIDLPAHTQGLAPGMLVKVAVASTDAPRLTVPAAAVIERSEMRAVYVVGKDGRVSMRQVRLGRAHGSDIEVLAGVVAGESVATDPVAAVLQARQAATTHE